jgi:hypothetical protein
MDRRETVETNHYSETVTMPVFGWAYLLKISRLMFRFRSIPCFKVLLYGGLSFITGTLLIRELEQV